MISCYIEDRLIRGLDLACSCIVLAVSLIPLIIIYIVLLTRGGRPIFVQKRIGLNAEVFDLYKFRTLPSGTAEMGSHLLTGINIGTFEQFLRQSKLDEIPQIFNVILGKMSMVGPRPSLTVQNEVIHERMQRGVLAIKPGITGLAQISRVDMSEPRKLSRVDALLLRKPKICLYLWILVMTIRGKNTRGT